MANGQADQSVKLIFKDQAGDYYLVPRELIEQCRVSAEERLEVERALAQATPIEAALADDTQAFLAPAMVAFLVGQAAGAESIAARGHTGYQYWRYAP